jgi:hypothetical protein
VADEFDLVWVFSTSAEQKSGNVAVFIASVHRVELP